MKRTLGAAAAACLALLLSSTAHASAVYDLPLIGSLYQAWDSGPDGQPYSETTSFQGVLELTVPDAADGEYFGAGLGITLQGIAGITSTMDHEFDVIVQGGKVVSFYGTGQADTGYLSTAWPLGGSSVVYDAGLSHGAYRIVAAVDAASVPQASPVPEPAGAALVLAGLGFLALRGRRSPPLRRA